MGDLPDFRPFTVFVDGAKEEGACLVFARSYTRAKTLGREVLDGWFFDVVRKEVRAHILENTAHVAAQFRCGVGEHVIDSPISCENCGMWDTVSPGECPTCRDAD